MTIDIVHNIYIYKLVDITFIYANWLLFSIYIIVNLEQQNSNDVELFVIKQFDCLWIHKY